MQQLKSVEGNYYENLCTRIWNLGSLDLYKTPVEGVETVLRQIPMAQHIFDLEQTMLMNKF